jgi:hypothetical protein
VFSIAAWQFKAVADVTAVVGSVATVVGRPSVRNLACEPFVPFARLYLMLSVVDPGLAADRVRHCALDQPWSPDRPR